MNERIEATWDAEQLVRGEEVSAMFGTNAGQRERARKRIPDLKAKLYAMLDTLSPEELRAYGEYRRNILKGEDA